MARDGYLNLIAALVNTIADMQGLVKVSHQVHKYFQVCGILLIGVLAPFLQPSDYFVQFIYDVSPRGRLIALPLLYVDVMIGFEIIVGVVASYLIHPAPSFLKGRRPQVCSNRILNGLVQIMIGDVVSYLVPFAAPGEGGKWN